MSERNDTGTTQANDLATEHTVLELVLFHHPTQMSVDELVREICGEDARFPARDAVERAIRDLVAVGLLHRGGGLVAPSLAALRFDDLLRL